MDAHGIVISPLSEISIPISKYVRTVKHERRGGVINRGSEVCIMKHEEISDGHML